MKAAVLVFLALCTLSAAMIPRFRRALPLDTEESQPNTTPAEPVRYCAHRTPCSWSIYKPINKIIEVNITNKYCICAPGMNCVDTEDDSVANAYVFRCRTPEQATEKYIHS